MTSALYMHFIPFAGTVTMPTQRGKFYPRSGLLFVRQSLPDDPVGLFSLTLTHLQLGSVIQIASLSGVVLATTTADTASKLLPLQVYSAGSPLNDLRIKVRKGSSSPYFQPWETFATAIVGSQAIYVSQIPDE